MKYRQTPPIQFLPVFEAAARHLSFKKAAVELCVTAPAVGQQIKAFEHWLGRSLFRRQTRCLTLTAEGEYYFQLAQRLMDVHRQGYIDYLRRFDSSAMVLSAPIFVAQEMIMPHYLEFSECVAKKELRVEARMSFVDFDLEQVDAAIRFGDGQWPELARRRLCRGYVAPVCSPGYAQKHRFTSPQDLSQHRLIYAHPVISGWASYFTADETPPPQTIICDSYMASLKAAANGLGVALAIFPTTHSWIRRGELVMPFPFQIDTNKSFWLVSPHSTAKNPEMDRLYIWLQQLFDSLPELDFPIETIPLDIHRVQTFQTRL
ncbi:MAG: LysR family transcriptional regulator [Hahellaceae bacterium]|nr:LysR family transcriptional regulator [Hahellaceae bacterium]MCP5169107.1 LysR family transcriptional regulator [Hahellaceae bacterium]